ncbi:MAG: hypothetical protein IJN13_05380 [Bacilli bacterium]|nr:hypothetical protein [Bacilli bacterium]
MKLFNQNKTILTIIGSLLLIFVISGGLLIWDYNSNKNKELDEVILNNNKGDNSMFAIMLEQDDGTYDESGSNTWPTDGERVYDQKLSGCIDANGNSIDNALSYDAVNNKVILRTQQASMCYLYFSFPPVDLTITLSGTTGTNQIGKYHKSIDCGSTGSGTFNHIYQRVEIGSVTAPVKCTLKYTATTEYQTLKSKVETVNASQNYNSHGYRYSGKFPNNWVWFNGEKWRIIGVIPTKTTNGTENLVKIIRSELIGGFYYSHSSSAETIWGGSSLYSLLNTHYYATNKNEMNGQNHAGCFSGGEAKPNCDYSEIGILANSYYGKMVRNVYWNIAISPYTSITANTAYTKEITSRTVSGYVGLMTASDYGYAADSSFHDTTMSSYDSAVATNWLSNGAGYLIIYENSGSSAGIIKVDSDGGLSVASGTSLVPVHPVVYLDSSVYIVSGDGTVGNPYQIGM